MRHPVDNPTISQGYQANKNLYGYGAFGHTGIDYGVWDGTIVRAVHTGTVVGVGTNENYVGGKYVIVRGSGGYEAYTGHMSRIDVSHGQQVTEGQQIGLSGRTGYVTGPHVHFQVRDSSGNLVNPLSLISASSAEGDDVITPDKVDVLRIGHSEIGGWDMNDTHSGKNDKIYLDAWNGKPEASFIRAQWQAGEAFRNARQAKAAFYDTWASKVGELSTRPTKAELDALNVALKASHQAVIDAEAKLAIELAKPPEVIVETVEKEVELTWKTVKPFLIQEFNKFIGRFKK